MLSEAFGLSCFFYWLVKNPKHLLIASFQRHDAALLLPWLSSAICHLRFESG
jgi:hypothetical protein